MVVRDYLGEQIIQLQWVLFNISPELEPDAAFCFQLLMASSFD